ncbi:hypothetical protein CBM2586_B130082 [Cupriavidus phytorum]|uniref:Uncharacterized protein n=1 Tax=Cupriavidus taiwanensis TaxID=164546 RepID=A0A975XHI7_9BURK|nr:hypothetical protein CBM2586_B130082 [Cupriavidus taiwanensis]
MRDMESLGGAADVLFLGHGDEIVKLTDIQHVQAWVIGEAQTYRVSSLSNSVLDRLNWPP